MIQVNRDSKIYSSAIHLLRREAGSPPTVLVYIVSEVWPEFENVTQYFPYYFFISYLTEYYSHLIGKIPPILCLNLWGGPET